MAERTERKSLGTIQKVKKFGLVGDGTVGKTTLLLTYTTQSFVKDYVPTVFDNFSVIEDMDDTRVNIILWDTAGQEDYVGVRKICYDNADVYFLCFSLVHPNSFHNIKSKWLPELRQYAPKATLFLVGTKTDLVDDPETLKSLKATEEKPITTKTAAALAKEIGAELFLTCSARSIESVNKVFRDALKFLLDREAKQLAADRKQWAKDIAKEEKMERELEKMRNKLEKERASSAAGNSSSSSTSTNSTAPTTTTNDNSTTTTTTTTTVATSTSTSSSGSNVKRRKKKKAATTSSAVAPPAINSSGSNTSTTAHDPDDSHEKSDSDSSSDS